MGLIFGEVWSSFLVTSGALFFEGFGFRNIKVFGSGFGPIFGRLDLLLLHLGVPWKEPVSGPHFGLFLDP